LSEDIAYLYNELAITYQGHDDIENAIKCVKKQLLIFEGLNKTNSLEYVQCLSFQGEMYKDLEMHKEAIVALEKAIQIHKAIIDEDKNSKSQVSMVSPNSMIPAELERSEIMKMLAEQLVFDGRTQDGIKVAYEALEI